MRISIPADVFCLVTLLRRLGFDPGALKTAQIDGEKVNVWFESFRGPIKRASAKLVRGVPGGGVESPRRVYLDLRVQRYDNKWQLVADTDYRSARLQTPWEYGKCREIIAQHESTSSGPRWPWTSEGETQARAWLATAGEEWSGPFGDQLKEFHDPVNPESWVKCPLPSEELTPDVAVASYVAIKYKALADIEALRTFRSRT